MIDPLPRITRRTMLSLLSAAAAIPPMVRLPDEFDAAAYIADMNDAGIDVIRTDDATVYVRKSGCRFSGFHQVNEKWQYAKHRCPDYNERVEAALAH